MKLLNFITSNKEKKLNFAERSIDFINLLETCQKHYKTSRYARDGHHFISTDAPPSSSFMKIAIKLGLVSYNNKDEYAGVHKHVYKYYPDKINMKDSANKEK